MIKRNAPQLFYRHSGVLGDRKIIDPRSEEIKFNRPGRLDQIGISGILHDNPKAAQRLFEAESFPHLDAIWQTALWLTENEEASAKLTQDVFADTFRAWDKMVPLLNCRLLLFKTMARLFFKGRDDDSKTHETISEEIIDESFFYDRPSLLKAIPCHIINKAIVSLLAEVRFVTVLSLFWGFTYSEIADIAGIQLETVKTRLYWGRRLIRRELINHLVAVDGINAVESAMN